MSAGGHFYTVDAMHMTEAMLRYDYDTASVGTNFDHACTSLAMIMMINGLKDSERNGEQKPVGVIRSQVMLIMDCASVYPRKGLAALCRLILKQHDYFSEPFDDPDLAMKNKRERAAGMKEGMIMDDHLIALKNAEMLQKELKLSSHQRENMDDDEEDFVLAGGFYNAEEMVDISAYKQKLNPDVQEVHEQEVKVQRERDASAKADKAAAKVARDAEKAAKAQMRTAKAKPKTVTLRRNPRRGHGDDAEHVN